jgi:hypothetical protein
MTEINQIDSTSKAHLYRIFSYEMDDNDEKFHTHKRFGHTI